MIKNCKFQSGLACHILVNNLGPKIFTPSIGVCYVFNFGIIEGNVTANIPTADSGLQLDIDINSELNEFFKYASLPAPFRWLGGHAQLIYWKVAKSLKGPKPRADSTHLLCKGKYHCMADILFDLFRFG